jgi:dTDP-4-amino-4,6-dideoxygalactose transaminase
MPEPDWSRSNRWLSACTVDTVVLGMDVQQLIRRLAAERIEARPVWKPMQLQPVFAQCRYFPHEGKSVSQRLFETGICLPSGSNMSEAQQERVIKTMVDLLKL